MIGDSVPVDADFDEAACGLLTTSIDGTILRANRTVCTWLGRPREEVQGHTFQKFLTVGGRVYSQTHWAPLMDMQGSIQELKLTLITRDGKRLPILLNAVRQSSAQGTVDRLALMIVAERHSYERELLSAQQTLQTTLHTLESEQFARNDVEMQLIKTNRDLVEANRFKDEFLATLAHELRNPLAPLKNASAIFRKTSNSPALQARLGGILERQVEHMTRLVDDLSDISRIVQGKIDLRRTFIDFNDLANGVIDGVRPALALASHQLITVPSTDVLTLHADPVRIAQVIQNLLNNAIKYTPTGGTIWFSARREANHLRLSIRDTGIGIAPEQLRSIFGMFSQLPEGIERAQGGLGIGLALVRALVELHDGSVDAISAGPGTGSEFIVIMPLASTQTPEAVATPFISPLTATPQRILIVDDDKDSAASLKMILQLDGHDVVTAYDGEGALDSANDFLPDSILLDIALPGISGYEVAKRLRLQPPFAHTTLVAIADRKRDDDAAITRTSGFDAYLTKPIDLTALEAILSSRSPR